MPAPVSNPNLRDPAPRAGRPGARARARRLESHHWGLVVVLITVPMAVISYKLSGLPGSDALARALSFAHLSHAMQLRTEHLLFTPLGALIVVFVRLTLGIRVLGPFRSVLLAIAFLVTGIAVGVVFFALVLAAVLVLRPFIRTFRMPYFGRSTALLASVAGLIILAMLAGSWLGFPQVERVAYFPVVVLTLTGEAFSTTLRREGWRSAVWRAGATAAVAVLITGLASIDALERALLNFPELVLVCLAALIVVCELMSFRLFQHLNPPPRKRRKGKKRRAAASAAAASQAPTAPALSAPGETPRAHLHAEPVETLAAATTLSSR